MSVCFVRFSCQQEVSVEEAASTEEDKIVNVFHFSKEASRSHGVPFKFVVKKVRYHPDAFYFYRRRPYASY